MNICFANAFYKHNYPGGGYAHMRQFVNHATELGNKVWTWHGEKQPNSESVPAGKIARLLKVRQMDVVYYRIEWKAPWCAHWGLQPYRTLIGNPLIVWEFNSVPEYALVLGQDQAEVDKCVQGLRHFGRGCDLAICVSNRISEYVKQKLGIQRVLTVPNGSDLELFRPDIPATPEIPRTADCLNVVWIGSAWIKWHNFELLRATAAEICRRGQAHRVNIHVIGNGFERATDTPPNMHYHGPKPYEQLASWLTPMDVGLCCYNPGAADYSSPLKVFDYMACGLTVVSTPQPQVHEVFEKLDQLDLILADNPVAMADGLLRLADDRARLAKQGAKSRRLAVDYYNWERAARETFDEIQKLRPGKKQAGPEPTAAQANGGGQCQEEVLRKC